MMHEFSIYVFKLSSVKCKKAVSVSELVVHLPPSKRSLTRYFGDIDSSII
jgi:hypothetical protein